MPAERYTRNKDGKLVCEECKKTSDNLKYIQHTPRCSLFGPSLLSHRELEILVLISRGRSVKEIAGDLNLSHKTVEAHKYNLMKKLDIHCIALLTRFVIEKVEKE